MLRYPQVGREHLGTKRLVYPGTTGNKRGDRLEKTYHSKSLYMIVKKTWRKRLTAFISTANRYSQASPDMVSVGTDSFYITGKP